MNEKPVTEYSDLTGMVKGMAGHLFDAMVMFEQIERNRDMPPFANTREQYIAKGREIRAFMKLHNLVKE